MNYKTTRNRLLQASLAGGLVLGGLPVHAQDIQPMEETHTSSMPQTGGPSQDVSSMPLEPSSTPDNTPSDNTAPSAPTADPAAPETPAVITEEIVEEASEQEEDKPSMPLPLDNHRKSDVKLNGIDISRWQDGIDPAAMDADFIICKASGGNGYRDPKFYEYASSILESGKLFGFYHFAHDRGCEDTPEKEAEFFYRTTRAYVGKGVPILDFEARDLLSAKDTDWAYRFVKAYYSLSGMKCMIYMSSYYTRTLDWSRLAEEGYPLWVANYGQNEVQNGYRENTFTDRAGTGAFEEYWMHQYSSRGRLEGYDGDLDLNKFFGSAEDWKSLCTVNEVPKTMYRVYNPNSGEHFYTADRNEWAFLCDAGWKDEGTAWQLPATGEPVFRLYNPNAGDHHYTMDAKEKDGLIRAGWTYEGIGWYSDLKEGTPVYRVYNPNARTGSHHFTTDSNEYSYLKKAGWNQEGIAWYGTVEESKEEKTVRENWISSSEHNNSSSQNKSIRVETPELNTASKRRATYPERPGENKDTKSSITVSSNPNGMKIHVQD